MLTIWTHEREEKTHLGWRVTSKTKTQKKKGNQDGFSPADHLATVRRVPITRDDILVGSCRRHHLRVTFVCNSPLSNWKKTLKKIQKIGARKLPLVWFIKFVEMPCLSLLLTAVNDHDGWIPAPGGWKKIEIEKWAGR